MAYILTYSGNQTGNNQITVQDATIFSSVGNVALPGRNYSGYGQPMDQNILSMVENFASQSLGPSNPITGQLWYNRAAGELRVNTSTANGNATWATLAISGSGNTAFGNITVTGTITGNVTGNLTGNVTGNLTGNVTGNLTGNVVGAASVQTALLTTGAVGTAGTVTGQWTLSPGSTLNSTYADLAERHHADKEYPTGTVMKVGGENEVTAASVGDRPLGVVSKEYAYLMNSEAGSDATHPAVAYVGRVPVRIVGPINKHDVIVPTLNGCARAGFATEGFGWALETNITDAEKMVLCIIR